MSKKCFLLTDSEGELFLVAFSQLSCLQSGCRRKTPGVQQISHQDIDVLVQIQLNKKPIHWFFTKGSINASGIWLRSR